MKKLLIILTLFIYFDGSAQECAIDDYFPLSVGNTWIYKYTTSSNRVKFKVTNHNIIKGSNSYYRHKIKDSKGNKSIAYYRNENGQNFIFDEVQNKEYINIPKKPKKGFKWSQNDTWEYEIININEELQTPVNSYKNLLKIRALQTIHNEKNKAKVYYLYFKKDIGQVASVVNGKLQTYLTKYSVN